PPRRAPRLAGGPGRPAAPPGRGGESPRTVQAQAPPPAAADGSNLPPNVPAWMRTPGAPATPYGERAPSEEGVVREVPDAGDSFSPLADLHGTVTPNGLWYEVHYGGSPPTPPSAHPVPA